MYIGFYDCDCVATTIKVKEWCIENKKKKFFIVITTIEYMAGTMQQHHHKIHFDSLEYLNSLWCSFTLSRSFMKESLCVEKYWHDDRVAQNKRNLFFRR